jgi:hypothetical protein
MRSRISWAVLDSGAAGSDERIENAGSGLLLTPERSGKLRATGCGNLRS